MYAIRSYYGNMAAFIEVEWGHDAYIMMKKIKALFDPKGLLNPGVIINDDKEAHLKNLKTLPATNEIVDKCIEWVVFCILMVSFFVFIFRSLYVLGS